MIRFLALGAPELRDSQAAELRGVLTQPRLLALLAYLAVDRPRGYRRRDSLVALLWPELAHESARNALRQVVHRLRRALGETALVSRGADELAIADAEVWCDVAAFEDALDAGRLSEALALYRGDLLPGFFTSDAPEFERWLDNERLRLRQRAAAAAWELVDRQERAGGVDSAVQWARWSVALTPDDEAASRKLIELQLRSGDRAGALRSHESLARRLAEEFETTPSPETQALIDAVHDPTVTVRRSTPAIAVEPVPMPTSVRVDSSAARLQRWRPAFLVAIGALALASTALLVADTRVVADAPRTLAVLPFNVRGGGDFTYLREGMVDLLSAKIEGGSGFHAIDPRSVMAAAVRLGGDALSDIRTSAPMARRLGAHWAISGEVLEIAGRLHLRGTLYDISREPREVGAASVSGEATALFQLVDDLVGRILANATPGRDSAVTSLAAQTTHSLSALKAFLEGEQALRSGREAEAAAAFRTAIAIDSTFALAQYRLAITATWTVINEVPDANVPAANAARNAARLSTLGRDLVRGYRAYKAIELDTAEIIYREVTRGHPDNVEAWLMLGETYFHYNTIVGRSPREAHEPFHRALALDPYNPHALIHLARLAALEGDTLELDTIARAYTSRHSDADRLLEMRALRAYLRNDLSERAAVAQRAQSAGDYTRVSLLQAALIYAQNFDGVGEVAATFRRAGQNPLAMSFSGRLLSEISLAKGKWRDDPAAGAFLIANDRDWILETEALVASERLFDVPRARLTQLRDSISVRRTYPTLPPSASASAPHVSGAEMREYLLGLLCSRLGDSLAARQHLAAMLRVSGGSASIAAGLAHGLRAEILRTSGDLEGAMAELDAFPFAAPEALNRIAHWGHHERFLRGELLVALGRYREALPWYDSAIHAYTAWIPASNLRRGEIHERLGNLARARFHYGRASAAWREADPEFRSLLRRAEEGLARVRAR